MNRVTLLPEVFLYNTLLIHLLIYIILNIKGLATTFSPSSSSQSPSPSPVHSRSPSSSPHTELPDTAAEKSQHQPPARDNHGHHRSHKESKALSHFAILVLDVS
jgi:hypothetical protein